MRLRHRTALAVYSPALHVALIEAELRFDEHAFLEAEIAKRKTAEEQIELSVVGQIALVEFHLLRDVKAELSTEYYPR